MRVEPIFQLPPPIAPDIAGSLKIPDLRARLGRTAYRVWCCLVWCRDFEGYTHASIAHLQRAGCGPRLTPIATKKALHRLRRAQLIQDDGWVFWKDRKVYRRRVFGGYLPGSDPTVPSNRWYGVMGLAQWGGKRAGCGRKGRCNFDVTAMLADDVLGGTPLIEKRGPKAIQPRKANLALIQEPMAAVGGGQKLSSGYLPPFQVGTRKTLICIKTSGAFFSEEKRPPQPAAPETIFQKSPEHLSTVTAAAPTPLTVVTAATPPAPVKPSTPPAQTNDPALGLRMGSSRRPAAQIGSSGGGGGARVPRYPGFSVTGGGATMPDPPQVPAESSDPEIALFLLRAYRGAMQSRTGEPCFVLAKTDLQKSKYYKQLVECGKMLRDGEIAPAAWAAFSVDVWRKHSASSAPPLSWVFMQTRIVERRGWFNSEEGCYRGGRVVHTPSQLQLVRRWHSMRWELLRLKSSGPVEVAAIVDKFFPGTLYDELVACAKAEAKEMRRKWESDAQAGRWLWD